MVDEVILDPLIAYTVGVAPCDKARLFETWPTQRPNQDIERDHRVFCEFIDTNDALS